MRHDLLTVAQQAGDVRTNLDNILSHRFLVQHRVEARDFIHFVGRQLEDFGDVANCLGAKIAGLLLGKPQSGNQGRPRVRVFPYYRIDFLASGFRQHGISAANL